jgi:signal transduction histidine kinase
VRRRLAVTVAAVTATLLIAFLLPLGYLVQRIARDREINAATAQARSLSPLISGSDPQALKVTVESSIRQDGRPLVVVLPDGTQLGWGTRTDRDALVLARRGHAFVHSVDDGVDVYQPVVGADGRTEVVVIHASDTRLRSGVVRSWAVLGGLGVVMLAAALLVADRVARSATSPLAEVATAARRLAEGDEAARAPDAGPPEVKSVAHALNLLADRVDALRDAERERLADLSHELRTPVTALRLDAEHLPPGEERDRLIAGVDRLEAAITGLITSARRGGAADPDGPADLAAAARHRLAFWSVAASEQRRAFPTAVPDEGVWVPVGARSLDAAIDALVGNALRHTPAGTEIGVTVNATDTHATFTVDDAGPGLASDSVVDRGVQGEVTGGTGLGLDIARRTAAAGGGQLHLERSPAGGARIVMRLRRVPAPD